MKNLNLTKKLYVNRTSDSRSHVTQNIGPKSPIGEIAQYFWHNNGIRCVCNQFSVHISVSVDFDINRNFQNCFHDNLFKGLPAFDPQLGHHQGVTVDNTPSSPCQFNLGEDTGLNQISLC